MSKTDPREALGKLLATVHRSMATYLSYAAPWTNGDDAGTLQALRLIADDQQALADRIAEHAVERYGRADVGGYPMAYTDLNDLAVDYLLRRLVEAQRRDVATIDECVRALQSDPAGRALAQEALGAAKAHLETLQELVGRSAARP